MPTETTINVVPKLGGNAYKKAADTDFDTSIFEDTDTSDDVNEFEVETSKKSKSEQFTEEWDEEVRKDLGDFEEDVDSVEDNNEDADIDDDSGEVVEDTDEDVKKDVPKEPRSEKRIKNLITKIKSIAAQKDAEFAEETAKLYQRIAFLESKINNQTGDLANVMVESAEKRLNAAKSKLRAAKENMDTEAELDAIDELTDAKSALREAQAMSKKAPNKEQQPAAGDISSTAIMSTKKTNAWVKANPEFAQNPQLAQFVASVAQSVESEGFEPFMDEYYEVINKRVNDRLAKMGVKYRAKGLYDSYTEFDDSLDFEEEPEQKKAPVKKAINPVAGNIPPSSKKSGTKARLSAEDVELARRMGVDPRVLLKQQVVSKGAEKGTTTTGSRVVKGWNEVFIPTKSKK